MLCVYICEAFITAGYNITYDDDIKTVHPNDITTQRY